MTMRLSLAVLLVGAVAALSAVQPCVAAPHVVAAGGGTVLVMREVEEQETVKRVDVDGTLLARCGDSDNDAGPNSDETDENEVEDPSSGVVVELDLDQAGKASDPPPHPRCQLRRCWKSCTRRGYNWGLCLCKKCHCYY